MLSKSSTIHSSATTIRELGHPSRRALYRWYQEHEHSEELHDEYQQVPKYSARRKEQALEYYFQHGRRLSGTVRVLGYPSRTLLAQWIDELRPGSRKVAIKAGRAVSFSEEQKRRAVIELCSQGGGTEFPSLRSEAL